MLSVEALEAGYGAAQVLFGVSFSIASGEVVTFLGRNGAIVAAKAAARGRAHGVSSPR